MKQRNTMIGLLFTGGVISYLDRAALSVAAPLIVKELDLAASSLGIVFSSFFVGYSIACFLGGIAADRVGPSRVILWTMLLWSIFCGLTAAGTTIASMIAIRFLFGVFEGPYQSNITKLVGNWFPTEMRATAISLSISGTTLGGALAGPVVGYIAVAYGWKVSFIVIAAFGIVWSLTWLFVGRDTPPGGPIVDELATIDGKLASDEKTRSAWSYMSMPDVLATAFAFFGFAYLLYFFLSWFPSYLTMERHLSVKDMSIVSAIPWTLGFVGYLLGGLVSDLICRRTGHAIKARKLVLVTCLLGAAICVVWAGYADSAFAAATLMSVSVFLLYMSANSYFAIVLELVPQQSVGTVSGYIHMIANFAGILAPIITGYMVDFSGSFGGAFALAGCIALIGALSVAILVRTRGIAQQGTTELQRAEVPT